MLSEAAVDHLAKIGFDPKMGARPLKRMINNHIKVPVSKMILFDGIAAKSVINVDIVGEEFTFDVAAEQKALEHDANTVS